MQSPAFVASKANLGYGAAFWVGTGSPATYTQMSEINAIVFADYTITEIDTTHLASPNTMEEAIPGMIKPGTIELTLNYIADATQAQVDTLAMARTIFPWEITGPVSGNKTLTIAGYGFITKKETGPWEPNKKQDFKVSVRAAGVITWTVA